MKKPYTKKAMSISFDNNNKMAITYKRLKENLVFLSLVNESHAQLCAEKEVHL